MKKPILFYALLAGASMIAFSGVAQAQDAPAADTTEESGEGLDEIVVTAQKVETKIQDTPIAIRAFTGEDLAKSGVTDVNGLARLAPDIGVTTDTVFTKIAIRGVSSVDISETSDPALTVAIDGEYLNRPVSLNASFFDLERIEVLRGPQGTLYGRNSTAGALNIIAAKPKLGAFGANGTIGYGNYDAIYAQGAVNLPLGDSAAVRVAAMHTQHDGYRDHGAIGRGDNANVDAARASVLFAPGNLEIYLAGEYVNVDQTAPSQYGFTVTTATPGVTQLGVSTTTYPTLAERSVPTNVDLPVNFDRSAFPLANLGLFKSEQYAIRGHIAYDFGGATLTYLAGYRDVDTESVQPLNGFIPETFTFRNNRLDSQTQSHELRLNGGQRGVFVWQAGAFYFKEDQYVARGLFLPLAAGGSFLNYFYRPTVKSESKAVFAQGSYWISPDVLSVTAGIRYTDDKKSAIYVNFGPRFGLGSAPPAITAAGSTTLRPSYAENKITWNVGLEYKPASANLLYAKVSKGYKGGGFDNVGMFKAENLMSYEVGSKNRFMNNTLEFNASAFYYDYKNQQIQVFVNPTVGSPTFNAGKSRVWGIETDTTVVLSDNDRAHLTVNYIDAKLVTFAGITAPTLANPTAGGANLVLNLSGNRPPQAPKWTIAAGYDHTFHLGDYKLVASAYTRFKSEYHLTAFNYAGDRQKAYTNTDLTLELVAPGDRFSVQGYVRNIENNAIKTYAAFTGGGINVYNWIFGTPRTYGVQGSFKF